MKSSVLTCIAATVPFAALAAPFEFAAQSEGNIRHGYNCLAIQKH